MLPRTLALACLPIVAGVAAGQAPSFLRLPAIADATADADQPTTNLGADPLVRSGKDFTNTPTFRVWFTRGHYQFDLAPLIGLPRPDIARVRVYQAQSNAAGCLDVTMHRVTSAWSEGTLTWQNKPTHDATVAARACVGDSFDLGLKTFDITALVHDWLNGVYPNLGVVIRDPTESTAGAARPLYAASREATNPDEHPYLELGWGTGPFGDACRPGRARPYLENALDIVRGTPALGDTYALLARYFPARGPLLHYLGVSDALWNGVPLPIDLTFLGFSGCHLLISPDLAVPQVADNRGLAELAVRVPNRPFARGLRLFHQAMTVDSNGQPTFSNGYAVRFF